MVQIWLTLQLEWTLATPLKARIIALMASCRREHISI